MSRWLLKLMLELDLLQNNPPPQIRSIRDRPTRRPSDQTRPKDEKPRFGKLGGIRQWVESVFDTMKGQLTLEEHGGRTIAAVYSRVAARLLALAAGTWHNWLIGEPTKRSLTAYDH